MTTVSALKSEISKTFKTLESSRGEDCQAAIDLMKQNLSIYRNQIAEKLKSERDVRVVRALVEVLIHSRDPAFVPLYAEGLRSDDQLLRTLCLAGLQSVRVPEAEQAIAAFKDSNRKIRLYSRP